jgi:hypothetical protein
MMIMFRVECKSTDHWDDYGSTHFEVFASNMQDAWKQALKLVDRADIKQVYAVKTI